MIPPSRQSITPSPCLRKFPGIPPPPRQIPSPPPSLRMLLEIPLSRQIPSPPPQCLNALSWHKWSKLSQGKWIYQGQWRWIVKKLKDEELWRICSYLYVIDWLFANCFDPNCKLFFVRECNNGMEPLLSWFWARRLLSCFYDSKIPLSIYSCVHLCVKHHTGYYAILAAIFGSSLSAIWWPFLSQVQSIEPEVSNPVIRLVLTQLLWTRDYRSNLAIRS